MGAGEYALLLQRISKILNFVVEYKKLPAKTKNDVTVYYYFAQLANERKSAIGVGRSPHTAKEDAARRLLLLLLLNYHQHLCANLAKEPDFQGG